VAAPLRCGVQMVRKQPQCRPLTRIGTLIATFAIAPAALGQRAFWCARYERQLGDGSPLSSLMTAKDWRSARASPRDGVRRKRGAKPRPDEQPAGRASQGIVKSTVINGQARMLSSRGGRGASDALRPDRT
jgi:hypothetical protein